MSHEQALAAAEAIPAIAEVPNFDGRWRNQMSSIMDIKVNGTSVTGTYNSASSSGGSPVTGAITGVTIGDLIAFTVLWQASGSITSWTGQLISEQGHPKIRTLWHLVTNVPDAQEPTNLWLSTFAGADEFVR